MANCPWRRSSGERKGEDASTSCCLSGMPSSCSARQAPCGRPGRPEKTEHLEDSGVVRANPMLMPGEATVASVCSCISSLYQSAHRWPQGKGCNHWGGVGRFTEGRPLVVHVGRFEAVMSKTWLVLPFTDVSFKPKNDVHRDGTDLFCFINVSYRCKIIKKSVCTKSLKMVMTSQLITLWIAQWLLSIVFVLHKAGNKHASY